jgi:iron complex outermembrane recepter protein
MKIVTDRISLKKTMLLGSVGSGLVLCAMALSATTFAQDAAKPDDAAAETIVVTGSRIARPDLETSSPIAVVGAAEFQLSGTVNVENVLNDLPQVIPGLNSNSNNPGDGTTTVDLRGLGASRNLVLVNNRRYINSGIGQTVDLNTIPAELIDRVEVVTGGRSAVYGSDAISGVINFVLKKNFQGALASANYRLTAKGDGSVFDTNAVIGGNFDDGKGNATLSVGYVKRSAVFQDQRSFTTQTLADNGDGTTFFGGSGSIPQLRYSVGGLNTRLGLAGTQIKFDSPTAVSTYDAARDQFNFAPDNYLQVPQERFLFAAQAHYEINDHAKPYIEAQFVNNRVDTQLAPTPISNATGGAISTHVFSPFLPANVRTALQAIDAAQTGIAQNDGYVTANYGRRLVEVGDRQSLNDRNAFRIVAGIEGDITGDWKYDGYYLYSRTRNTETQNGNTSKSRFQASTKTVFLNEATGATSLSPLAGFVLACADATARASGCAPANIYGAGQISAAAAKYLSIGTSNSEIAETQVASGYVSNGNLFNFGYGAEPVGIAIGAEWRSEAARTINDFALSSGDVVGFNGGESTRGRYSVKEIYSELVVPIAADIPGINLLEVNGAARYADYSSAVGTAFTWTLGGRYKPIPDVTLRGQYARAIRAPNVGELFLGNSQNFPTVVDPCQAASAATNAAVRAICISTGVPAALVGTTLGSGNSQIQSTVGGNANLTEERTTTFTVGVLLQPQFIENFSLAVDYFDIKVKDFISTVGAQNIVDLCYGGNTAFCGTIVRDSDGEINDLFDGNQNTGALNTSGIDVDLNYKINLGFGIGGTEDSSLSFKMNGTYLRNFDFFPVALLPTLINDNEGTFGNTTGEPLPKWRHTFRTTYNSGPITASLLWRYIGKTTDDDDQVLSGTTFALEKIKAYNYFDLSFGVQVGETTNLTLGVDNLFNKKPPLGGDNIQQANTYPSTYDVLGRTFFAGVKVKF